MKKKKLKKCRQPNTFLQWTANSMTWSPCTNCHNHSSLYLNCSFALATFYESKCDCLQMCCCCYCNVFVDIVAVVVLFCYLTAGHFHVFDFISFISFLLFVHCPFKVEFIMIKSSSSFGLVFSFFFFSFSLWTCFIQYLWLLTN